LACRGPRARKSEYAARLLTSVVLDVCDRGVRQLTIQGLSVFDTSPQEFWPRRDSDFRGHVLWQQSPKLRMMPAEIMTTAVAVMSDSSAQSLDLVDQLFAGHPIQVFVHTSPKAF
jgi:hypothetical protein